MPATDGTKINVGYGSFVSLLNISIIKCHFAGLSARRVTIDPFCCLTYRQWSWVEVQKRLLKTKSALGSKVTRRYTFAVIMLAGGLWHQKRRRFVSFFINTHSVRPMWMVPLFGLKYRFFWNVWHNYTLCQNYRLYVQNINCDRKYNDRNRPNKQSTN